jgi:hypothetical protein
MENLWHRLRCAGRVAGIALCAAYASESDSIAKWRAEISLRKLIRAFWIHHALTEFAESACSAIRRAPTCRHSEFGALLYIRLRIVAREEVTDSKLNVISRRSDHRTKAFLNFRY